MDRDETAALLVVLLCGGVLSLAGAVGSARECDEEQTAWRQLLRPAILASIPFFVLLGWAVADPEGPETLAVTRLVALVPFAFVWIRAGVRAARSASRGRPGHAATVGLLRPRVVISSTLRAALGFGELRAAIAHEEAHVRHRDPLRIWIGQLVTDLQWPMPRARARQRVWMRALELARDEEAVRRGSVDPIDLANAIVMASRLSEPVKSSVVRAALGDDAAFLERRIFRLLGSGISAPPTPRRRRSPLLPLAISLALGAFLVGVFAAGPVVLVVAGTP